MAAAAPAAATAGPATPDSWLPDCCTVGCCTVGCWTVGWAAAAAFGAVPVMNAEVRPALASGWTVGVVRVCSTGFSCVSVLSRWSPRPTAPEPDPAAAPAASPAAAPAVPAVGRSPAFTPGSAACWPVPVGTSRP